ncbi:MAG: hypothetical protein GXY55_16440 [Phycisphaerae bacterium]|nr:hypothetical protein [Phycisphaerae bacterium]
MRRHILCTAMLFLVPVVSRAAGQGVYVDAAGGRHEWTITETHALLWNGEPFMPFGTWFVSHYLDTGREEQWAEDVAALELLIGKGITDFYFGWANRPPEMYQRLIDWFEAHGCTYGIIPARYDWDPLYGYKMSPQRHDLPAADPLRITGDSERLQLAGTAFVLVGQAGESLQAGAREAEAPGREIILSEELSACHGTLWCIRRVRVAGSNGFDWWSGFQRHTDNVISFLNALRTGPGLRLVIDPFFNEEGFYWGTENVIPDRAAYRDAFKGWLRERYPTVAALNEAWSVASDPLTSHEQAARLIPIVVGQRHGDVGYLLDPTSERVVHVDLHRSVVLLDLLEARDTLYARLHNEIADAIRARALNVPIVYKRVGWLWRGFVNRREQGGFDGLGLEVYKAGEAYDVPAATYASELRQSRRPMWYITTETNHAPQGERPAGLIGYPSRETLWADLDRQMALGVKGIYIFAAQPQNGRKIFEPEYDLLAVPEQYDWFAAYKQKVLAEAGGRIAHHPAAWFSFPVNSPDLVDSGDMTSSSVPIDAWRVPNQDRSWVWPTYHADAETDLLVTCLDTVPLNRRYGPELAAVLGRAKTRVLYAGLRPHRERVPGLDEFFTDTRRTEDGATYQILRPTDRCEILAKLRTGEVWALRADGLTIVARDGVLRQWVQGQSPPGLPLDRVFAP